MQESGRRTVAPVPRFVDTWPKVTVPETPTDRDDANCSNDLTGNDESPEKAIGGQQDSLNTRTSDGAA